MDVFGKKVTQQSLSRNLTLVGFVNSNFSVISVADLGNFLAEDIHRTAPAKN